MFRTISKGLTYMSWEFQKEKKKKNELKFSKIGERHKLRD